MGQRLGPCCAQEYFSFEAFQHVLAQLGSLQRVPENLPTPRYTILRKYKDFEVRRCGSQPLYAIVHAQRITAQRAMQILDPPLHPNPGPHAGVVRWPILVPSALK